MSVKITWNNPTDWAVKKTPAAGPARRAALAAPPDFPPQFLAAPVTVAAAFDATPRVSPRRAAACPVVDVTVEAGPNESCVLALRHPSGALTFHGPDEVTLTRRHRDVRAGAAARFRVEVRSTPVASAGPRRGLLVSAIKVIVLKVLGRVADALLPTLALRFERRAWKKRGLVEGWFGIDQPSLRSGQLRRGAPDGTAGSGRSLLFLHGTFSHAVMAFKELAGGDFFPRVAPLYGGRIFAFNHFTLSRTPDENARALLQALPDRPQVFDVITHSRGGLVLRSLVERRSQFGALARRFELGHAVLVASPNDGTPLATPSRWRETVGWFANLLELFPDNPLTLAVECVAEAIVWLAQRAAGGLPGLGAMDARGRLIEELQSPPGPPPSAYSALVARFEADGAVWRRLLDAGMDGFFATASDLVVPTEGGWRVDRDGLMHVPAERIGCFGPGGNLAGATADGVHHSSFFRRPETVNFLVRALSRAPQNLPLLDPRCPLPDRRFFRAAAGRAASRAGTGAEPGPGPAGVPVGDARELVIGEPDTFHLIILPPANENCPAQLLATYGSARVLEPFRTRGESDGAGERWRRIIAMHEGIRNYIDGKAGSHLPGDAQLIAYGEVLFRTLFPGQAGRLYDTARSRQGRRRLDVIFTSMIPWVADKPWEFAYDPARKNFLATEDIHFIRNVLTAVPAEVLPPRSGPLRILVAVAQPVGAGPLSAEDETTVIRRGFESLIEAGLAEVKVLPRATPASLHGWISTGHFDVVHFIGHGEFDKDLQKGFLLFESEKGAAQRVDDRTMREILCQRGIRLVFLNACETGRGGRAEFNHGVAPALVAGGVPAVVANQYKVLDASATSFAQHFYWSLAQGLPLGEAAREARIAVNYSIAGETIDWAVPVVYARDSGARLCQTPVQGRLVLAPQTSCSARRSTEKHTRRVAVWDVSGAFPRLDETLERLNRAQSRFGFERVDLSAPIGTWQVPERAQQCGRLPHLHANRIAQRLKNKPRELGVDCLACLTNAPMMCDSNKGVVGPPIHGWWPVPRNEPVILFSPVFLGLPSFGPMTDKALANALVACLAGLRLGLEPHKRGPATCPLHASPRRSLKRLAGKQLFDATCRRHLAAEAPQDLPALEALLRVFQD